MRSRFFGRSSSDSDRFRSSPAGDLARRSGTTRDHAGRRARQEPWWKDWLGIGTKREWLWVGLVVVVGIGYTYKQDGLAGAGWAAFVTAGALLVGVWMKRQEKAEENRKPVLRLRDSERDEYGRKR